MELWNEIITEKSQRILFELKKEFNFIIIGGWACWFYTKTIKSKDLDLYINFDDFFALQSAFLKHGITITLNQKLNKYEAVLDEIAIYIYTPHHCNLIIPCKDVFKNKWFKKQNGFKVIAPELLLILKLEAEKQRTGTIKGFKDRIDILSLISRIKIDKNFLIKLANSYKVDIKRINSIIKNSLKEYEYFFPEAKNLRALKKLKQELLKNSNRKKKNSNRKKTKR